MEARAIPCQPIAARDQLVTSLMRATPPRVTLVRERFGQTDREREKETAMTQLAIEIVHVAGRADIQQRKSTRTA